MGAVRAERVRVLFALARGRSRLLPACSRLRAPVCWPCSPSYPRPRCSVSDQAVSDSCSWASVSVRSSPLASFPLWRGMSEDAVVATGTLGVAAALLGLALNDTTVVAIGVRRVGRSGMAALPVDPQRRVAAGGARVGPACGLALYLSVFMGGLPSEAPDGASSATRSARKVPSPGARSPSRSYRCSPCGGASARPAVSTCPRAHVRTRNAAPAGGREWTGTRHAHV